MLKQEGDANNLSYDPASLNSNNCSSNQATEEARHRCGFRDAHYIHMSGNTLAGEFWSRESRLGSGLGLLSSLDITNKSFHGRGK